MRQRRFGSLMHASFRVAQRRLAPCVSLVLGSVACERADEVDPVNPQPEIGISETEKVGARGTEPGGVFARARKAAAPDARAEGATPASSAALGPSGSQ